MSAENIINAANAVLGVYSDDVIGLRHEIKYMKEQAISLSPSPTKLFIRAPSGSYTFEISDNILINNIKVGKQVYNKARRMLEKRQEGQIGSYFFYDIKFSRTGGQEWSGKLKDKNNTILISDRMPLEVL
jgi:hypothetical protein